MATREVEALERWIAEYRETGTPSEGASLAARLDELMRTPEGDEPENWDHLLLSAERIARRGSTAAARAASRTLVALVEGDERVIDVLAPPPAVPEAPPRRRLVSGRVLAIVAGVLAVALVAGVAVARSRMTPSLVVVGPAHGAQIGVAAVGGLAFTARGSHADLRNERWTFDGRDVTRRVEFTDGKLVFRPAGLKDGAHELKVTLGGGFLGASAHKQFNFDVDLTPPELSVAPLATAISWHPVEIHGTVAAGSTVRVEGRPAALDGGEFSVHLQPPVPALVPVVATDVAGNTTVDEVTVALTPRRPSAAVRAVHVTAAAWADPALRKGVMALIAQHRVNTLEIDLKDEGGVVGFGGVAAANAIGSTHDYYNLAATVKMLHAKGVRVIGRLVCFRDPIAAAASWKAGRHNEVIQTPAGKPYALYGGFTNFANPAVRRYEIAIAVAAARDGVDEVLYDYVRRPDGPIASMVFPGIKGTPSQSIVEFLRETRVALEPYGTYLGASVFGIAATRPDEVAQDVPAMARELDYVSPMVYPALWNNGEYNVADPNEEPYAIVQKSLLDFKREVAGTGARLVPWLQDFSLGVSYGPAQVRAQIDGARKDGVNEFLLWNPNVVYDGAGLRPNARAERPDKPPR